MGLQSNVFGYIELEPSMNQENKKILDNFVYDENYPFPNIFSGLNQGYLCSMVSFAGSFKNFEEDWDNFLKKFEHLLGKLAAYSAEVIHEVESLGRVLTVSYVADKPRPFEAMGISGQSKWVKYTKFENETDENVTEEEELLL